MSDMTPEQAILHVAQQIAANAVREVQWEEYPEIGEYDWDRIVTELDRLVPESRFFDEAITVLERRAKIGGSDE